MMSSVTYITQWKVLQTWLYHSLIEDLLLVLIFHRRIQVLFKIQVDLWLLLSFLNEIFSYFYLKTYLSFDIFLCLIFKKPRTWLHFLLSLLLQFLLPILLLILWLSRIALLFTWVWAFLLHIQRRRMLSIVRKCSHLLIWYVLCGF